MKQVIVLHGTGGSPKHFWFPYLKRTLPQNKYQVHIPQLPNASNPDIKEWLPFVLKKFDFNQNTILVGHSAGCPLILGILENIDVKISKAILVAGFINNPKPLAILQAKYDWATIKKHSKHFVFINSVNDPWGCNDIQGRKMFDKLGGDLIIRENQGHMGSVKFNQPYRKFPLIKFLIEN